MIDGGKTWKGVVQGEAIGVMSPEDRVAYEERPLPRASKGAAQLPGAVKHRRTRGWYFWLPVTGLLAILVAKLHAYLPLDSVKRVLPTGQLAHEESENAPSSPAPTNPDRQSRHDLPIITRDPNPFTMIAPYVPLDSSSFDTSPLLKPQTVGFALAARGEETEPVDPQALPKAWRGFTDEQTPRKVPSQIHLGAKDQNTAAVDIPLDLEWLAQYSSFAIADGEVGSIQPQPIPSSAAIEIARRLDSQAHGGERSEGVQESEADAPVRRRFGRVLNSVKDRLSATVLGVEKLTPTQWDYRARMLRAEFALLEVSNDIKRLRERQETALAAVQQALKAQADAGEEQMDKQSNEVELASSVYRGLLLAEKQLLHLLLEYAALWKTETKEVLTNMSSVVSSPNFRLIEDIASCLNTKFASAKVGVKMVALGKTLPKETRSKNYCSLVEGVAKARLAEIKYRLRNICSLGSKEASEKIDELRRLAANEREKGRQLLAKKNNPTWIVDII